MSEPTLQRRRTSDDGWVLSPTGATVAEAISSADVSNATNRQRLARKGCKVLTIHNSNDVPRDYRGTCPSLATSEKVVEIVAKRKPKKLAELEADLILATEELDEGDLPKGDRSNLKVRKKDLERAIARIKDDNVTGAELHRAFRREDVKVKAREVDPAMRAAIEAYESARTESAMLAEEDSLGDEWAGDDFDPQQPDSEETLQGQGEAVDSERVL